MGDGRLNWLFMRLLTPLTPLYGISIFQNPHGWPISERDTLVCMVLSPRLSVVARLAQALQVVPIEVSAALRAWCPVVYRVGRREAAESTVLTVSMAALTHGVSFHVCSPTLAPSPCRIELLQLGLLRSVLVAVALSRAK